MSVVSYAGTETITVISHEPVAEPMSQNVLRAIFLLRINHWQDGNPITVFTLVNNHPLHEKFSKQVLGVFPYQLQRAWDRNIFAGIGSAPNVVPDITTMIEKVRQTKGAIGYINKDMSNDSTHIVNIQE